MLRLVRAALFVSCVTLLVAPALAQDKRDKLGAALGLTPENNAVPGWTEPSANSVQEMVTTVKRLREAILLVGDPEVGTGTAFVISKKHRLLATNSHVADIMHENGKMMAIRNGTAVVYEVDKLWYHPGVRRWKSNNVNVRSADPADGEVDPRSPDVAVLHLADGGPDLPIEMPMATAEEVEDLLAAPIGMLGFPGHDTDAFPKIGQKAQATLREGVVCRLTDFLDAVDGAPAEMQKIQHSLAAWSGFSGSPLFLPNGHVIGLHNSGKEVANDSNTRHVQLAYGVRIDCLWELLAYHKLDDKVSLPIAKSKLLLARYEKPDPQIEKFNQAEMLVKECDTLITAKKFTEAVEKCNEASKIFPAYSKAYFVRAVCYTLYNTARFTAGTTSDAPINPEQLKYATYALQDAEKYMKMNPTDPEAQLLYCMKALDVNIIRHKLDPEVYDAIVGVSTKIIKSRSFSSRIRARAYSARAAAKTMRPDEAEIRDDIYEDYGMALKLDPYNPSLWRNRGGYDAAGSQLEADDYRRADEIDAANQMSDEATWLATAPEEKDRDGRKAWELAAKACKTTNYEEPHHLLALAFAYAETGDFEHALEYNKKATQFAEDDMRPLLARTQKLFENKLPFRQGGE